MALVKREIMAYIGAMKKHERTVTLRVGYYLDRRGWSQGELARITGIAQPSISKILGGKTGSVDFGTLAKIASAFGVHPGDLLAWDGDPARPGKRYESF
jgi:DNA-binding Xre family transcriptional regulator